MLYYIYHPFGYGRLYKRPQRSMTYKGYRRRQEDIACGFPQRLSVSPLYGHYRTLRNYLQHGQLFRSKKNLQKKFVFYLKRALYCWRQQYWVNNCGLFNLFCENRELSSISLLIELLYLCYHVLDLLVNLQEVGIEDSLTRLDGREVIELRQRVLGIGFLLLGNLGHVEVGLAEELAGLELLGLLDVHRRSSLWACRLSSNPAPASPCSH